MQGSGRLILLAESPGNRGCGRSHQDDGPCQVEPSPWAAIMRMAVTMKSEAPAIKPSLWEHGLVPLGLEGEEGSHKG